MSIKFSCGCGKRLRAGSDQAGRRTYCPRCGTLVAVPDGKLTQPGALAPMSPEERRRQARDRNAAVSALPAEHVRTAVSARTTPQKPAGYELADPSPTGAPLASVPANPLAHDFVQRLIEQNEAEAAAPKPRPTRYEWTLERHWYECLYYPFRAAILLLLLAFSLSLCHVIGVTMLPALYELPAAGRWPYLFLLIIPFALLGYAWGSLDCVLSSGMAGEVASVRWPGGNLLLVVQSLITWVLAFFAGPVLPAAVAFLFWYHAGEMQPVDWFIVFELVMLAATLWLFAVVSAERRERLRDLHPVRVVDLIHGLGWSALGVGLFVSVMSVAHLAWAVVATIHIHTEPIEGWFLSLLCWLSGLYWAMFLLRVLGVWYHGLRKAGRELPVDDSAETERPRKRARRPDGQPLQSNLVAVALLLAALGVPCRAQEPVDAAAVIARVRELEKEKDYAGAAAALRKLSAAAPADHRVLALLSQYERLAGDYRSGLEHALAALKGDSTAGVYHVLAAANAFGVHDVERVREHVRRAREHGRDLDAANRLLLVRLDDSVTEWTYTIHWAQDPTKSPVRGTLTVAVPTDRLPYQATRVTVTGARSHQPLRTEANDLLQVVPVGTRAYELTTRTTVKPHSYLSALRQETRGAPPAAVRPYLGPSELIDTRSPRIQKIASGLKASTAEATVRNVVAWLGKNIRYELSQKEITKLDFKTLDEVIERGHAECRGYTSLFVALSRAADVPARPIWGLMKLPGTEKVPKGDLTSHTWAEFYANGVGWVPVDPQTPETVGMLPASHIRVFMDDKRSKTSQEKLPLDLLVVMNGEKLRFEMEP